MMRRSIFLSYLFLFHFSSFFCVFRCSFFYFPLFCLSLFAFLTIDTWNTVSVVPDILTISLRYSRLFLSVKDSAILVKWYDSVKWVCMRVEMWAYEMRSKVVLNSITSDVFYNKTPIYNHTDMNYSETLINTESGYISMWTGEFERFICL